MSDKRSDIIQAMLELVAERGLQDAPMSLVAKRSGASPGVIYHYFASKDDLLRAAYVEVKTGAMAAMNAITLEDLPPREAFVRMWTNAYAYYVAHPAQARFLDQFEGTPCYKTAELGALMAEDENYAALRRRFFTGAGQFPLKNLPISIINELSFAVAARLAVRQAPLDEATQVEIARSCWQAVSV